MRISSKGQITIPQNIREKAGLLPHTEVEFVAKEDGVKIVKARTPRRADRGAIVLERLRKSAKHVTMTTDEVMALTRGDE
jgi:AbrB family looped-hinge helix DNA binding protein